MKRIPERLCALGWNRRVLTFDDFLDLCRREHIRLYSTAMCWRGLYFYYRGRPVIVLNERLRRHQLTLTAFHEFGHHLFAVPGRHGYHGKTELEADIIAHIALIPAFLLNLPDGELWEMFGYEPELIAERVRIFQCFNL